MNLLIGYIVCYIVGLYEIIQPLIYFPITIPLVRTNSWGGEYAAFVTIVTSPSSSSSTDAATLSIIHQEVGPFEKIGYVKVLYVISRNDIRIWKI